MAESHHISQIRQLIKRRVVDVICCVETNEGLYRTPRPKGAGGQGCDAAVQGGRRGGCWVEDCGEGGRAAVDARGEGEGRVGLDCVAESREGDLRCR